MTTGGPDSNAPPEPAAAAAGNGGAPPPARHSALRIWLAGFAKLVPFIGDPLSDWIKQVTPRTLLWVGAVLWFLFVYPLILPLLTAFSVPKVLNDKWHEAYSEEVRSAFRMPQMATKMSDATNARLDYFHAFKLVFPARDAESYEIPAESFQRVTLHAEAFFVPGSNGCEAQAHLLGNNAGLVKVSIGGKDILLIRNGASSESVTLDARTWADISPKLGAKGRIKLIFDPVPELRACGGLQLEVRARIEVFKDLVQQPVVSADATKERV